MKKLLFSLLCISAFVSCQKSLTGDVNASTNFKSTEAFFKKNEPALQTYSVNSATGGSFTSPQGTKVTIPSATFIKLADNSLVSGEVTIEFRDIYKKSDMLLSGMPTTMASGQLLKSAGEFFIKASLSDEPLQLAPGKTIEVEQPVALTGNLDDGQSAFAIADTVALDSAIVPNNAGWVQTDWGRVVGTSISYVYSLYRLSAAPDSGTWCNSDNPYYFNSSPQTVLTINPTDDLTQYQTDVFLLFKNVAAMVHVYAYDRQFPYDYAPVGFDCTMVAIAVKDGKLYASFKPITITENLTVDFTLSATTADELLAQIKALD